MPRRFTDTILCCALWCVVAVIVVVFGIASACRRESAAEEPLEW